MIWDVLPQFTTTTPFSSVSSNAPIGTFAFAPVAWTFVSVLYVTLQVPVTTRSEPAEPLLPPDAPSPPEFRQASRGPRRTIRSATRIRRRYIMDPSLARHFWRSP